MERLERIFKRKQYSEIVFDSREEALQYGITDFLEKKEAFADQSKVVVGKWWVYDDGRVARILHVKPDNTGKGYNCYITTIINKFRLVKSAPIVAIWQRTYHRGGKRETELNLDKITMDKVSFAEGWLLRGYTLETCVKYYMWAKYNNVYQKDSERTKYSKKMFAYRVLSGPWFQKLLLENKVIRDRYMSLVGAFDAIGLTRDFVAGELKKMIEKGTERERINALNKVLDVLEAEESRKASSGKAILLGAQWKELKSVEEEERHVNQLTGGGNASTEEADRADQVVTGSTQAAENLDGEAGEALPENGRESGTETVNQADKEGGLDLDEEIRAIRQEIYAKENLPQLQAEKKGE